MAALTVLKVAVFIFGPFFNFGSGILSHPIPRTPPGRGALAGSKEFIESLALVMI
jgi:hypothetical protein